MFWNAPFLTILLTAANVIENLSYLFVRNAYFVIES